MVENKISPSDLLSPVKFFLRFPSIYIWMLLTLSKQTKQDKNLPKKQTTKELKNNTKFKKRDSQNIFLLVIY